jgi:GT2 family glycosyltransferase
MKSKVTAVVVSHDASDYLSATLQALSQQTVSVGRTILVETSTVARQASDEAAAGRAPVGSTAELIRLPANPSLPESLRAAIESVESAEDSWIWILHDDSAPEPDCLEQLLLLEEKSSLAALIGPKQIDWHDSKRILQQGLTLTPLGAPLSLVADQLDQSQHDDASDVMAIGTAGALVRSDVFKNIGGLDYKAPPLAADFDLSIRVKLAGYRVLVAPKARIRHAGLSLDGKRSRTWLKGSPKLALRKAAIHLRMAYQPLWSVLLFWLALGPITIIRVFWRFLQKRPDRILSEIGAGLWGFFTVFSRLSSRRPNVAKPMRAIRKAFDAPWSRVRESNRSRLDAEEADDLREAFERGEQELSIVAKGKSFVGAGGLAWMLVLLAISWNFVPTAAAAYGRAILPLDHTWLAVFARAGSSWQPLGRGFAGPAEPFNWVLLGLASLTPWLPSIAITMILFAALALAFAGAWRASTLVTSKTWVRNFVALGYALWPSLVQARSEARLASVVAIIALPWLVFAVARAAGLGRSGSARSMRQTWSWVGLSGLLLAVVGVSSETLLLPILLAFAVAAFTRIRRFGYLFWVPLPVAALLTPLALNLLVSNLHPVGLLADPSLPLATVPAANVFGLPLPTAGPVWAIGYLTVFAIALFALLTKRWVFAGVLWLFALLTLGLAYVHSNIHFANPASALSDQTVNGSPATLLSAAGLIVLTLFAIAAEHAKRWPRRFLALAMAFAVVAPLSVEASVAARNFQYRDDRVVPWLLDASSQQGSSLRMVIIQPAGKTFVAQWAPISGLKLEDANVAYRYALADLNSRDKNYSDLAGLVAALVSSNGTNIDKALSNSHIGFVLVPNDQTSASSDLANSLDSVAQLDPAGLTDFGRLWRVNVNVQPGPTAAKSPWSITKVTQISVLLAFLLLAIPTASSSRRRAKEADIFIDSDGDAQ